MEEGRVEEGRGRTSIYPTSSPQLESWHMHGYRTECSFIMFLSKKKQKVMRVRVSYVETRNMHERLKSGDLLVRNLSRYLFVLLSCDKFGAST
jgi:hypothetical protein